MTMVIQLAVCVCKHLECSGMRKSLSYNKSTTAYHSPRVNGHASELNSDNVCLRAWRSVVTDARNADKMRLLLPA